jgi:DNA-binding transcriptional MerR regulator
MSAAERDELTIRELADLAGTTVRTIHYYIAEGLVPPPRGVKRNASYNLAHLARLRLIAALRDEGLALAAIRARLAPLTDEQALTIADDLEAHLAAGDRSLTILALIEAALAREAGGQIAPEPIDEIPAPQTPHSSASRANRMEDHSMPTLSFTDSPEAVHSISFPSQDRTESTARDDDSASDYLQRLLRKSPPKRPMPPRPLPPRPVPPQPKPDPYLTIRPETWHHFEIADGIELRVRDDRYREGRGQLRAIVDSLRPILYRYGLTTRPDADNEP